MNAIRYIGSNIVWVLVLPIMSCLSCVESFPVEPKTFDKVLVIEGRFTNEPDAHTVKLSYTRPLDEGVSVGMSGAEVWIEGTNGSRFELIEVQSGWYITDSSAFGVPEVGYQLHIRKDERSYQSSIQYLTYSPPIDSIYYQYKELVVDPEEPVYPGVQFFVATNDASDQARFYRYEWEETYEIRPPYPSLYEFQQDPDTVVLRRVPIHICYTTEYSSSPILGSTAGLTSSQLNDVNIRYITNQTDHLKHAYSILVYQYAISQQAYTFYRSLLERNEHLGSLFDRQLGPLIGNMSSSDENEIVLGLFEVSGKSSRRAFTKFDYLDSRFPSPKDKFPCALDQIDTVLEPGPPPPYLISDSLAYYVINKGYDVIEALYCDSTRNIDESCPFYMRALVIPKYCADCRFRGTTEKPEFWIY